MAEKNSLWKNIRNKAAKNRRTGATPKKPTAEMLRQERKIKAKKYPGGGETNPLYKSNEDYAYEAWRNSLPQNLRQESEGYDLRGAWEAGLQPEYVTDDMAFHLSSRNPNTGEILKLPGHDTYNMAIEGDIRMGYTPRVDVRTGKIYTTNYNDPAIEGPFVEYPNVQPPVLLDDNIIYPTDYPLLPGLNKDIIDAKYNEYEKWRREFINNEGMTPEEYYQMYPTKQEFDRKTFNPSSRGVQLANGGFTGEDNKPVTLYKKAYYDSNTGKIIEYAGSENNKYYVTPNTPQGIDFESRLPEFEVIGQGTEKPKSYKSIFPKGLSENDAENTYSNFTDQYKDYSRKGSIIRDTVIDLTNQKMGWFPFDAIPNEQYSSILGNNYVERKVGNTGSPEDYAKNWITRMSNPEDTFRNKDYAEEAGSYYHSKDIPAFYGIENGKFKVGSPKDFSENTIIVPVRNSTTPYSKIDVEKGLFTNTMYTYDKEGNKIWNLDSKDKFIVYSPKTKKSFFRAQLNDMTYGKSKEEENSLEKTKKILEDFLKQNPDAYIIPIDEGRFKSYTANPGGVTEDQFKNWNAKAGTILENYLLQDSQNPNTPINSPIGTGYGYNMGIIKQKSKGGYMYDDDDKKKKSKTKEYTNRSEFNKANKAYNDSLMLSNRFPMPPSNYIIEPYEFDEYIYEVVGTDPSGADILKKVKNKREPIEPIGMTPHGIKQRSRYREEGSSDVTESSQTNRPIYKAPEVKPIFRQLEIKSLPSKPYKSESTEPGIIPTPPKVEFGQPNMNNFFEGTYEKYKRSPYEDPMYRVWISGQQQQIVPESEFKKLSDQYLLKDLEAPDLGGNLYDKPKATGGYTNPYMYYAGGPMQYKRGGVLEDVGKLWLNFMASPLEQISGNNFVNFNYNNKGFANAAAIQEGIAGAGTDFAGSVFLGPAYGMGKGAIQGVTKNLGHSQEYQRGADNWANKTGQIASSAGNLTAGIMSGNPQQIISGAGQVLGTTGSQLGSKELSAAGQLVGIGSRFVNPSQGMPSTSNLPILPDTGIQTTEPIVNQGLSFASYGGNINNNSLNLQNSMRNRYNSYRKKSKGGTFHQYGINQIPDSAGLHHQNAYGGVPIGQDAMAEGGEYVLDGNYVVSDQVDGMNTQTDEFGNTMAENLKTRLNKYTLRDLDSKNKDKPRRPNDSISEKTIEQIKQQAMMETEMARAEAQAQEEQNMAMRKAAVQYAAAGGKLNKDITKIVEEEYAAAYGGYINPKKYKGLNMPYSGGGKLPKEVLRARVEAHMSPEQADAYVDQYAKGGSIHIKKSKRGTFTAAAKKRGKSVQEFARQVLANKDNYSSAMVKKANFAKNAAGWKHAYGGPMVSNVPQPFTGPSAQNRGGIMIEYGKGGNMYAVGGPDIDPEKLKAEGFVEQNDYWYNPKTKQFIYKNESVSNNAPFANTIFNSDFRSSDPFIAYHGAINNPNYGGVVQGSEEFFNPEYDYQYFDTDNQGYGIWNVNTLSKSRQQQIKDYYSKSLQKQNQPVQNENELLDEFISENDITRKFNIPKPEPKQPVTSQTPINVTPPYEGGYNPEIPSGYFSTDESGNLVSSDEMYRPKKFQTAPKIVGGKSSYDLNLDSNPMLEEIQRVPSIDAIQSKTDITELPPPTMLTPENTNTRPYSNRWSLDPKPESLMTDENGNVIAYDSPAQYFAYKPKASSNKVSNINQSDEGLTALDYGSGLLQAAGPFSQFLYGVQGSDDVNYQRVGAEFIDPTKAIILSNEEARRAQDLAGYNLRQYAPTSGSFMSNIRGLGLAAGKQRAGMAAGLQAQADAANVEIKNRINQFNNQIAMQEQIDRLQEKDAARTNVTEGLSGMGSSTANMIRDYRTNKINKTIAKNIGTGNTMLVRNPDGTYSVVMKPTDQNNWTPTLYNNPYKQSEPAVNTGANVSTTNVTPAANTTSSAPLENVPPQPKLNGKPSTGPKGQAWLKKYGATHNPDGTPKQQVTTP